VRNLIGRRGEWVTRASGAKVCRVARDFGGTDYVERSLFDEWQGQEPRTGDLLPLHEDDSWVRPGIGGGLSICIEGEWR
jgi:hypothetical protein